MTRLTKKIAILSENPALTALMGKTLDVRREISVYSFATLPALITMLRITPIDMVVLDADGLGDPGAAIRHLRAGGTASTEFSIAMLTRAAEPFHAGLLRQGADLVLRKPVNPAVLLERVSLTLWPGERLMTADGVYAGPERRSRPRAPLPARLERHDNVITLFR